MDARMDRCMGGWNACMDGWMDTINSKPFLKISANKQNDAEVCLGVCP
jgi:hypothetical protein